MVWGVCLGKHAHHYISDITISPNTANIAPCTQILKWVIGPRGDRSRERRGHREEGGAVTPVGVYFPGAEPSPSPQPRASAEAGGAPAPRGGAGRLASRGATASVHARLLRDSCCASLGRVRRPRDLPPPAPPAPAPALLPRPQRGARAAAGRPSSSSSGCGIPQVIRRHRVAEGEPHGSCDCARWRAPSLSAAASP